jgi:hypothetical protein
MADIVQGGQLVSLGHLRRQFLFELRQHILESQQMWRKLRYQHIAPALSGGDAVDVVQSLAKGGYVFLSWNFLFGRILDHRTSHSYYYTAHLVRKQKPCAVVCASTPVKV